MAAETQGPGVTRLGDVKLPRVTTVATGFAVLAAILLLIWDRQLSFFFDDWSFLLTLREAPLVTYFQPSNQHWSTLPAVVFKLILGWVGMRSAWPYLAVVTVAHVAIAWLLFRVTRPRAGDLPALLVMALFMFLARGARDFTWAFQIGFLGSLLCGLVAMVLLERPDRTWRGLLGASLLLLLGMTSSGQGLFIALAVAAELLLDPPRRRYLVALVLPFLGYGIWFQLFAAGDRRSSGGSMLKGLLQAPVQVPDGIGSALGGIAGLPHQYYAVPLVLASAWLAIALYRRSLGPRTLAALIALLAYYGALALVRYEANDPWTSRYLYVGAMYCLIVLSEGFRDLPWTPRWRPLVGGAMAGLVLVNLGGLYYFIFNRNPAFVAIQNTALMTVEALGQAPDADLDRILMEASDQVVDTPVVVLPFTARRYLGELPHLGSPVPPVRAAELETLPPGGVDRAMRLLFGRALETPTTSSGSVAGEEIALAGTASVELALPPGTQLTLQGAGPGRAEFTLAWRDAFPPTPTASLSWQPGVPVTVRLPDPGRELTWRLQVRAAEGAGTLWVARP